MKEAAIALVVRTFSLKLFKCINLLREIVVRDKRIPEAKGLVSP
jgi:hypothetical protein